MKKNIHSSVLHLTDSQTIRYRNKITNEQYNGGSHDAGITYIDGVKFRRVFPVNVGQRSVLIRDDALERCS